jgi:hypothetical protein
MLVGQPVEIRPYALVHFPPVDTAENCRTTVTPLWGEVKSFILNVNPNRRFFMTICGWAEEITEMSDSL